MTSFQPSPVDAMSNALVAARQWIEANTAQVRVLSRGAAASGEVMLAQIDAALSGGVAQQPTLDFPVNSKWELHRQPRDLIADHEFAVFYDGKIVVLASEMPGEECILSVIMDALKAVSSQRPTALSNISAVMDFLNSIEGAGYGGMASFEIARMYVRDMVDSGRTL